MRDRAKEEKKKFTAKFYNQRQPKINWPPIRVTSTPGRLLGGSVARSVCDYR